MIVIKSNPSTCYTELENKPKSNYITFLLYLASNKTKINYIYVILDLKVV